MLVQQTDKEYNAVLGLRDAGLYLNLRDKETIWFFVSHTLKRHFRLN
jgi:hypothetical protein